MHQQFSSTVYRVFTGMERYIRLLCMCGVESSQLAPSGRKRRSSRAAPSMHISHMASLLLLTLAMAISVPSANAACSEGKPMI